MERATALRTGLRWQ